MAEVEERKRTERQKEANERFRVSSDGSKLCDLARSALYSVPLRSMVGHSIGLREVSCGNRVESSADIQ